MALTEQTRAEMMDLAARYPQPRSALLPMLHLAQSVEGYVTPEAIVMCAEVLGLTTAEVKGWRRSTRCSRTSRSGSTTSVCASTRAAGSSAVTPSGTP